MRPFIKILTFILITQINGQRQKRPPPSNRNKSCAYEYARVWIGSEFYENSRTLYDKKQGECAITLGSLCNLGSRGTSNCPTNAHCSGYSTRGYCLCNQGYAKGESEVICGKIVGHGDSCHNEEIGGDALVCNIHSGFTCQNGTCQCLSPETTVTENKCQPLVGEKCYDASESMNSKLPCPDHASCENQSTGTKPADYKCECQDGYLATDGGKCGGSPGTPCDADNPCFKSLTCADGQCVCPQPLNQIFDEQKKMCLNLVKASCNVEKGDCTEFSECSPVFGCTCKDGYVETLLRTCRSRGSGHGDTCESGTCNEKKGLACLQGKCECVDSSLEYEDGVCVASDGKRCGWMTPPSGKQCSEGGANACRSYFVRCEDDSSCVYKAEGFWVCQ